MPADYDPVNQDLGDLGAVPIKVVFAAFDEYVLAFFGFVVWRVESGWKYGPVSRRAAL